MFFSFLNNQHVVKREECTKKVYHIFHTNVCIIHIYKDLYVYSHTSFSSTCWVVVGDCSTNLRWYREITRGFDWLLTSCWCFTVCLFVRVYRHSLRVSLWESPKTSHPWSEYWDQFFFFLWPPLFGQHLHLHLSWSRPLATGGLNQGHLIRALSNLDDRPFQEAMSNKTFLVFPIFDLWFGEAPSSVTSGSVPDIWAIGGARSQSRALISIFFYMKLVEDPLGALPSCCHLGLCWELVCGRVSEGRWFSWRWPIELSGSRLRSLPSSITRLLSSLDTSTADFLLFTSIMLMLLMWPLV